MGEEDYQVSYRSNKDYTEFLKDNGAIPNFLGIYHRSWYHPSWINKFKRERGNSGVALGAKITETTTPKDTSEKQSSIPKEKDRILKGSSISNLLNLGNNQGYAVNGYQDNANAALNGYKSVSDLQTFLNGLIDSGY